MDNTIQYKGYAGSVEFYEEDGIFYGKVMGICSLISYKGESAKELLDDFHVHSPGDPIPRGSFFLLSKIRIFYKVQINLRYGIFLHSDVSR